MCLSARRGSVEMEVVVNLRCKPDKADGVSIVKKLSLVPMFPVPGRWGWRSKRRRMADLFRAETGRDFSTKDLPVSSGGFRRSWHQVALVRDQVGDCP